MNIDHIVKAYAFTADDKRYLINILAQAYLQAKAQAYQKAQSRVGHVVRIRQPWQVSDSDVAKAQQWASKQVESVAETYETLLRHALEEMPEERAIGDIIGKAKQIVAAVGEWVKGFLPWKTQQIANQTWGTGTNDGTNEFVEDVQDEDNVDEVISGGKSMLRVVVLPANSSDDECAGVAGVTFELGDAPKLPMHINCIHYLEMVIVDE